MGGKIDPFFDTPERQEAERKRVEEFMDGIKKQLAENDLCQCPTCGRMHRPLGFGPPPSAGKRST